MSDRWREVKTAHANSAFAAEMLQKHFPTDNIEVGESAFLEMKKFREPPKINTTALRSLLRLNLMIG